MQFLGYKAAFRAIQRDNTLELLLCITSSLDETV